MEDINNKKYLTLKETAEVFEYNSDYIGFLIRKGKIKGKKVHSNISWRITKQAIIKYCQKTKREVKNIDNIQGKYLTLKEAAKISGYAPDYIGYLIRRGKIKGKKVCPQISWLVNRKEIERYKILKNQRLSAKESPREFPFFPITSGARKMFSLGWRLALAAFIIFFFVSGFAPIKFLQGTIGAVFIEEPKTVDFYATSCNGDMSVDTASWQNPQNVQGPPDVGPTGDINSFSEVNSAVYKTGLLSFVCQSFGEPKNTAQEPLIEEQQEATTTGATSTSPSVDEPVSFFENPKGILLGSFGARVKGFFGFQTVEAERTPTLEEMSNSQFLSAKIKFSFAIGEKEPDIFPIEQPATSSETGNNSTSSEEQIGFWGRVRDFFNFLANKIVWAIKSLASRINLIAKAEETPLIDTGGNTETGSLSTSTSSEEIITETPVPDPVPDEGQATTTEPTIEEATTTETIDADVTATSTEVMSEATTTDATTTDEVIEVTDGIATTSEVTPAPDIPDVDAGQATTSEITTTTDETPMILEMATSTESLPNLDTKIIVWWSLDGISWQILDTISSYPLSNLLNGGYFEYDASFLSNWDDVKNLKIKFEGVVGGETNVITYLDSVWVEVTYKGQAVQEEQPPAQPPTQPVEQPIEQPTDQSTQQPTEQPPEQPSDQPTDQPIEQPLEQPTEQPTEQPAEESPAEEPPAEEPPAEEPTEETEITEEVIGPEEIIEEEQAKKLPKIKIKENSLIFIDLEEDFRSDEEPVFVIGEPGITLQELISSGEGELLEGEIIPIDIFTPLATTTPFSTSTIPIAPTPLTTSTTSTIPTVSTTSTPVISSTSTTSSAPIASSPTSTIPTTSTAPTISATSTTSSISTIPTTSTTSTTSTVSSTSTTQEGLDYESKYLGFNLQYYLQRGGEFLKKVFEKIRGLAFYLREIVAFIVPRVEAQSVAIKNKVKIKVFDPEGKESFLNPQIISRLVNGKDGFEIKLPKPGRDFKPGKWKMEVELETDEAVFVVEKDFTWGVLAINTNKSIYISDKQQETSDTAYIQMAALDELGHTICDANLRLEITSPNGDIAYPEIKKSGKCGPNNVVDVPDYFAHYQVGKSGLYQMKLTNLDTGYEITDSF
ncbi:MAG: hypothetical protein ACE5WD_12585, partial [Candidatus Aminicenantia bacterium]